jgi:hypothetical protein
LNQEEMLMLAYFRFLLIQMGLCRHLLNPHLNRLPFPSLQPQHPLWRLQVKKTEPDLKLMRRYHYCQGRFLFGWFRRRQL